MLFPFWRVPHTICRSECVCNAKRPRRHTEEQRNLVCRVASGERLHGQCHCFCNGSRKPDRSTPEQNVPHQQNMMACCSISACKKVAEKMKGPPEYSPRASLNAHSESSNCRLKTCLKASKKMILRGETHEHKGMVAPVRFLTARRPVHTTAGLDTGQQLLDHESHSEELAILIDLITNA